MACSPTGVCDNQSMMAGLLRGAGVILAVVGVGGCATQHGTSQALTVAGAAAVVVGASMAADEQCYGSPSGGAALVDCAANTSTGVRNTGKAIAVAGVGLAAAGYALKPKGPDNLQRVRSDPDAAPASPYRLIRRDPQPESLPEPTPEPPSEAAPGGAEGAAEGDVAAPGPESAPPAANPGDPVEPRRPCPPGGSAGPAAAGACSPERAPAVAPTSGAR
jgi:hypothetical protein